MTATVNFEAPQLKVDNGTTGIVISQVILPYSIRSNEDSSQYLGGQTVLTQEDGIALTDKTDDWYQKALVKLKDMVATTEIYNHDVTTEVETENSGDLSDNMTEAKTTDDTSVTANAEVAPDTQE